ncbi:MAG: hypothetical protein AUJ52_02895 [Elusimicrobia bacterium CG1_02_63_36]|nr:MAG: hypothetical protein AUJ52_02895 [Elusimicrobia bacterium CG1_02_63_36]PIP81879.1 MAG: hypothetical protein COR54_17935 [Elusimicrobia bacterium CG22_combo_CG10-13_8_21_14_all_63_91]PJA12587.1 MAG: hypothetical protein COX66_16920 [Elusimicrobia bacterium CG_4_10_14_0_2_um_filter_63_34]PJB25166.1 MAG: hypothetical protein CO113_10150 [Elusimicrobia bacterium CG_4_9_14_3_um_filter_62_55]
MKRFLILLPFLLIFSSCDDGAGGGGAPKEEEEPAMTGSSDSGGGGSGEVALGGDRQEGTIADRYETALKMIRDRDWDGAREQLLEAMKRSEGKDIQKEIRGHLKLVERGILAQPTYYTPEIFGMQEKMMGKRVSARGRFISGGPVGKVSYYFWLDAGGKIQCRYEDLPLDSKQKILLLKDGAEVLVRGTLKSPWGSNPNPYLELNYFRLEKLAPKQAEPSEEKSAPARSSVPAP